MVETKDQYSYKDLVEDLFHHISQVPTTRHNVSESSFLSEFFDSANGVSAPDDTLKKGSFFHGSNSQREICASFSKVEQTLKQTSDLLEYPEAIPRELDILGTKLEDTFSTIQEKLSSLN